MSKNTAQKLRLEPLEPRQMLTVTLAELTAIGADQETVDLLGNADGAFVGDIGPNNPGSPDVSLTPFVLNEPTLRNVVDAVAASETVPAGATVLTTASQVLSQITAGTPGSPNVYHILGDITLAPAETIVVPSNVEIYVEGSIFKAGQFTAAQALGPENNVDSIFDINGSSNIRLVGINNALLHSTPSFNSNDPHTSGVIITDGADNITFEGFETRFLWNAVNSRFNVTNVTIRGNLIKDTINRSIWFLGTSDSSTVHNFIANAGADTIDYDAFAADNVAFENVLIGAGRFTFFVEEGANNNFSVRQLSVIHRFDQTSRPNGFQLGNTSNSTGPIFFSNNGGDANGDALFTRDNFFLDNVTYAPSSQQFRGDFVATRGTAAGNSYFFGNRGFSSGFANETITFGRDLAFRAIFEDVLPGEPILAARDSVFDSETGFRAYNLVDTLNGLIDEFGSPTPIRPEILPDPVIPRVVFQESGGQVVLEAENYTRQDAGTSGKFFGLLLDDDIGGQQTSPGDSAVGGRGVIVERNTGVNFGNTLDGPRLDYEIDFATPGVYNIHVRTVSRVRPAVDDDPLVDRLTDQSTPTTNDSVHVGLNGVAVSTGAGFGVGTLSPTWVFTNDVQNGAQNITLTITEPGRHTFNIWAREDGTQVDRVVLTTSAAAPTGFGPAESATLATSPIAGDYDLDLDVDDDDFQVWLESFGSTDTPWADGNGDGVVNSADYAVWRTALAATTPAALAAAEEPAASAVEAPALEAPSVDEAFAAATLTPTLSAPLASAPTAVPTSIEPAAVNAALLLLVSDTPAAEPEAIEEAFAASEAEEEPATDTTTIEDTLV